MVGIVLKPLMEELNILCLNLVINALPHAHMYIFLKDVTWSYYFLIVNILVILPLVNYVPNSLLFCLLCNIKMLYILEMFYFYAYFCICFTKAFHKEI